MDNATRILNAALPHVVFDGWTDSVLEVAAKEVGLDAFAVKRAFPNGVGDAIALFSKQADEKMLAALPDLTKLKIRERIATAVMTRLRQQVGQREAIRRAIGFYTLPWNMAAGTSVMWATCDAIWRAAGDTATDYNHYTKRGMLAGVITSTVSVWLNDSSENLADTEAFLARRIENVMSIEKAKAKAKDSFGKLDAWLPDFARKV